MYLYYRSNNFEFFSLLAFLFFGFLIWVAYIFIQGYFEDMQQKNEIGEKEKVRKIKDQLNLEQTNLINRIKNVRLSMSVKGYNHIFIQNEIHSIRKTYKNRRYYNTEWESMTIERRLDELQDYCKNRKIFNLQDFEKPLLCRHIYDQM